MNTTRGYALALTVVGLLCGMPAAAQTTEDLIAVHKAFMAALDGHKADVAASYFSNDGIWDWVPEPAPYVGKEQISAAFAAQFVHSPDYHTDAGRVMAAGNIVVVEHTTLGTQTGPLAGLPPTGKPWSYPHMCIYDFEGNKIKRLTSYCDNAGFYMQLGVMPASAMPALVPSIAVPAPEPTGLSPLAADAEHIRRWNNHDAAAMARIYHADCKIFAGPLGAKVDRVTMTAMNELYFSAFPDIKIEVVRRIDLGNRWVLTEFMTRGTHQGTFFGVPAKGYPTVLRAAWLTHYTADGLLIEGDFYYDNMTLMTQMTTAPGPRLDGAWVVVAQGPNGPIVHNSFNTAQDAQGLRYTQIVEHTQCSPSVWGMLPEANSHSQMMGLMEYTGPKALKGTMVHYGLKVGGIEDRLVYIAVTSWEGNVVDEDHLAFRDTISFYLPAQDADHDGLPDPGQKTFLCVPFDGTATRIKLAPMCVPTPVPAPPK